MAKFPSSGVNIPGYLNTCNSPSMSGYQDAIGNPFWMGLTPGKIITLGPNETANQAAPGTVMGDGAYQWVQLDSGATASLATEGYAAYIRLDSGATQGAIPETSYAIPTVTTADIANLEGLLNYMCGIFVNPATYQGQANGPTPGNWTFIFVGAGRARVQYGATSTATVGDQVVPDAATGKFKSVAAPGTYTLLPVGIAATPTPANNIGLAYYSEFITRLPF